MSLSVKNLPSLMCTGCKHYEFKKGHGYPHHCSGSGSWTNGSKLGQHPDKDGTANSCGEFEPR